MRVTVKIIGRLSINDGDGNDNATNKQFDWLREENKRAARVAHTHEQVRRHPLQNNVKLQCLNSMFTVLMTTWAHNCSALILCT